MSLAEKWDKLWDSWAESKNRVEPSRYWKARMSEAFYAGAEAYQQELKAQGCWRIDQEIDHFRSHK